MKRVNMILGVAVLGAMMTSPITASAADRNFCRAYTDQALRKAQQARQMRCLRQFEYNLARWSLDGNGHYSWCVTVPRDYAEQERAIRTDSLRECQRR